MEINWVALLPTIVPTAVAIIFALIALVLKLKKDKLTGMSKEVSELLLSLYEGSKDGKLTTTEIENIISEAMDVIDEAKLLLEGK